MRTRRRRFSSRRASASTGIRRATARIRFAELSDSTRRHVPWILLGNAFQGTGLGYVTLACTGVADDARVHDRREQPAEIVRRSGSADAGHMPARASSTRTIRTSSIRSRTSRRSASIASCRGERSSRSTVCTVTRTNGIMIIDKNLKGPRMVNGVPYTDINGRVLYADTISATGAVTERRAESHQLPWRTAGGVQPGHVLRHERKHRLQLHAHRPAEEEVQRCARDERLVHAHEVDGRAEPHVGPRRFELPERPQLQRPADGHDAGHVGVRTSEPRAVLRHVDAAVEVDGLLLVLRGDVRLRDVLHGEQRRPQRRRHHHQRRDLRPDGSDGSQGLAVREPRHRVPRS